VAIAVSECVARKPIEAGQHVATTIVNGVRYGEPAEDGDRHIVGPNGNGQAVNGGTYGDRIVVFCGWSWSDGKPSYPYVDELPRLKQFHADTETIRLIK
jgi:hypothetical protein